MDNIRKIVVLRANALGDFLVTLPALQALRKAFPGAEIILLGKPWHKKFLVPGRCVVDRVIVVPVYSGIRDEPGEPDATQEEMDSFFAQMRSEQFDIAIHLQGNGISANPFINRLGAGKTFGLTCENAEPVTRAVPFSYYQSEVMRYLDVVALAGGKPDSFSGCIDILPEDEEEIKELPDLIFETPFVVIHPFAMDLRRGWIIDHFIKLADALTSRNIRVMFTGSTKDREPVDHILSKMRNDAVNICGKVSLGGLAALLARAELVIAPDTGPLHLARAVNTPTVGMYWAPNFINWGPLSRQKDKPIISWQMKCPYCGIVPNDPYPFLPQNGCTHEVSFIRDITVDDVLEASEAYLPKPGVPASGLKIKEMSEKMI